MSLILEVIDQREGVGDFGDADDQKSWIITIKISNPEMGTARCFEMVQGDTEIQDMWSMKGEKGVKSACVYGLKQAGLVKGAKFCLSNVKPKGEQR